jgi:hypothetical protein
MFFTRIRYKAIKIGRSCFKMVLRTPKNTKIYPGLCPFFEVITLRSVEDIEDKQRVVNIEFEKFAW